MVIRTIQGLFERDLESVIGELGRYGNEDDIWVLEDGIANSAGNLAQHIAGNIKHFFGAVLGGTGFERDRDSEFNSRGSARAALISDLEEAKQVLTETFSRLSDDILQQEYPLEFAGRVVGNDFMLIHLLTHLNYHLGQINYHRRIVSGRS